MTDLTEAEAQRTRAERHLLPNKLSVTVQSRTVAGVELLPGFTTDDARKLKGGEGAQFRADAVHMVELETARTAQLHDIVGSNDILLACDGVIMDPADWAMLDAALAAAQAQVVAGEDQGDSDVKEIAIVSACLMETARYQAVAAPVEAAAGPPAIVDVPAITQAGSVLSCTMGNWTGEPTTYAYAWQINGSPVGSDSPDHTASALDVSQNATCQVTASNAQGSASATSAPYYIAAP